MGNMNLERKINLQQIIVNIKNKILKLINLKSVLTIILKLSKPYLRTIFVVEYLLIKKAKRNFHQKKA
jgi:hypothetical protein